MNGENKKSYLFESKIPRSTATIDRVSSRESKDDDARSRWRQDLQMQERIDERYEFEQMQISGLKFPMDKDG